MSRAYPKHFSDLLSATGLLIVKLSPYHAQQVDDIIFYGAEYFSSGYVFSTLRVKPCLHSLGLGIGANPYHLRSNSLEGLVVKIPKARFPPLPVGRSPLKPDHFHQFEILALANAIT